MMNMCFVTQMATSGYGAKSNRRRRELSPTGENRGESGSVPQVFCGTRFTLVSLTAPEIEVVTVVWKEPRRRRSTVQERRERRERRVKSTEFRVGRAGHCATAVSRIAVARRPAGFQPEFTTVGNSAICLPFSRVQRRRSDPFANIMGLTH